MPNSPNILNYHVGKGDLYFTPDGGAERHMGNCPSYVITPSAEFLDHYSSRSGVGIKDRSVPTRLTASIAITLDEITPENLALALFGDDPELNSDGDMEFRIMTNSIREGSLRLVGMNDVGSRYRVVLDKVQFKPQEDVPFISEEYGQIVLNAELLEVVAGQGFGSVTEISDEPST